MNRRVYGGARLLGSGPSLDNVAKIDFGAMPMLTRMMTGGLRVDLAYFERMEKALTIDMDRISEKVRDLTGYRINLDSGDQVADLLFKKLGLKQARSKLTPSQKRESVDEDVLTAIQHDHECIPQILDYKELSKLVGTYVRPMPKLACHVGFGEWRMFPNLHHGRVPSGRFNCKEPNLLAMPSRTARGREIRKGFIADDGWVYLSVDESQIEVRVCGHCSGDPGITRIYQNGEDIYSDFAISAFRLPDTRYFDKAKKKWIYPSVDVNEHRFPSKTCILAVIYDVSPPGLLEQMPVICANCFLPATKHTCGTFKPLWTEDKCADIINAAYRTYPGILTDRRVHHRRAHQHGFIWDMWGRVLHLAAVKSVHPWVVSAALREGGNFPYQGGACGTLKLTMAAVDDDFASSGMYELARPLLPIHDELLFMAHESVAEEVIEQIKWRFETSAPLKVPIKAGGAIAATWGDIAK